MAEASRRAARTPARGGHPNAVFVASGVDRLPAELDGIADRVSVRFPWGSLLRGALGLDEPMTGAIARLVAPSGTLELTLSLTDRDAVEGREPGPLDDADTARIGAAFARHHLALDRGDDLGPADLACLGSTWARRLRVGTERPVRHFRFVRSRTIPDDDGLISTDGRRNAADIG
ncbi:MAG: hypothetical protein ACHQ3P_05115 [Candidatus Limnocylindrales bacterium]